MGSDARTAARQARAGHHPHLVAGAGTGWPFGARQTRRSQADDQQDGRPKDLEEEGRDEENRKEEGHKEDERCEEKDDGAQVGEARDEVQRPPSEETLVHVSNPFSAQIVVALLVTACAGPGSGMTAYVGAHLFDGTGAALIDDAVLLVADGHIEAVGPAEQVSVPRGADVVDVAGRWIIPGLIDGYARAERWALGPMLSYGVTSIRAVGGVQDSAIFLRTDVQAGATAGPRLYITGALIDGTPSPFPGATAVRTGNDARRAVDNRVLIDASFVAVGSKLTRSLLVPLIHEARTLETPVSGELGRMNALTAARAGITAIDRLTGIVEATIGTGGSLADAHRDYTRGRIAAAVAWGRLDSAALHRTARALNREGTWLIPALVTYETLSRLTDRAFVDSLDAAGVPDAIRASWDPAALMRRLGLRRSSVNGMRRSRAAQDLFVRLFRREGGRVVPGTTAPDELIPPGAALHHELELLVAAGLSPREALLAATRQGAALLRADTIGVLTPGAVADFVVIAGDPLADIRNTRRVTMVVTYGIGYAPAELRRTP